MCFVIGVLGLVALAVAVIYFAVGIPAAIQSYQDSCPELLADPCNSFFGVQENNSGR